MPMAPNSGNDVTMARLGVALAVGLLVGLQRQFAKQSDGDDLFAGARTFALIGLMGGIGTLICSAIRQRPADW